jgi:hypothetical protein
LAALANNADYIDEIEHQSDIAFVRTSSDDEIRFLKNNIIIKNDTQELFCYEACE